MDRLTIMYALSSNLCFAFASQIFTHFSRRTSPEFVNFVKASVAFFCFTFVVVFFKFSDFNLLPLFDIFILFISGLIGLGLGDLFLLRSYNIMGPGRTLILFGFQPFFTGIIGHLFFNQDMALHKLTAIFFFLLCLAVFSWERARNTGRWEPIALMVGLLAITLDCSGLLMSRFVFDRYPALSPAGANMWRCLGAITFLGAKAFFSAQSKNPSKPLASYWEEMTKQSRWTLLAGSFLGSFFSLMLYYIALKTAHLATITSMAIAGTIFSSAFECLVEKKWPSRYLMIAFVCFFLGMRILMS